MNKENLWQAVLQRDARCDGAFVYGVTSTRIFCRPTCPSRRPSPENVAFFESPGEAKAAGFRACKRCRPEGSATIAGKVERAARALESDGVPTPIPLQFKSATGVSERDYSEATKLSKLKTELREGKSVTQAQNEAGYGSARALYERAPAQLGMTPATYGKGGLGAKIRFATAPCALGFLLVAKTEVGVCRVALRLTEDELEPVLREEFFAAEISRDDGALQSELETVLASLAGQEPWPQLPLDIRATAWQWRVWQELQRIPRGETRSYSELAAHMGNPNSTRAVARACATNPVALVHPCHRVVGKNGDFTGFRWGVGTKRALLEMEKG